MCLRARVTWDLHPLFIEVPQNEVTAQRTQRVQSCQVAMVILLLRDRAEAVGFALTIKTLADRRPSLGVS